MNQILNPYIAGAPVVETSMFFGREDVFSWIERSLAGKYVDHILVLHGQRRVGKTSVLKQIPNFLPDTYIQVFFDLQGRTGTTLSRFLWWLASEIVRTLNRERDFQLPKPDRNAFEDTEYLINEFLPNLRPMLGQQILLLTFDEFDTLDRAEIQETLARPLIAYLRRLIEMEGLSFIFSIGSSGDKLENMQASYTDFFKSALYRKISFLTKDDCQRLIAKPVEGLIKYEKKAVEQIARISSGHPYFTQLMCHELFSRCQKTGAREITAKDVDEILVDVIERGTVNLKFVWDEASDLEKWILAALAQMDGGNIQQLGQVLQEQRVRFSDSDLNSAVIHLRDKDVLTKDNHFVIYLMRMWLVANRPMDRVREELVEVNPIANRYIEIGDEYRDRGQMQTAIESYEQALRADPENLKAQTNVATIHLEQENYQEAINAFELALKIDDEDVSVRSGYCDAHLALADAAQSRGETDEALGLLQAILVLNPAHTDARERLATIYRNQAEGLLDTGKDDEALKAFEQALMFTPDDPSLSTRYANVAVEKKNKAIHVWLDKAEKALSRQRWDDAVEMVETAIKVDPENKELQAKLREVKDAPRQFKLQSYRREAEQAVARGSWEKAIAAIEVAIQLAPEDKMLREWLQSLRSDQANAQLDLYVRQADKAVKEGAWDAAVDAIKEAIKLAPEDETWRLRLGEIEDARRQVRLDALRAKVGEARKNSRWDEAIAALEELLKLEDSDQTRAEIENIRSEKRQSELAAFRQEAENATRAENWDDAVRAWEKYLTLSPDGGDHVEEKLAHACKYARIAGDYVAAQGAMRKKRYGKAIELLQGIIAQEPTYKATSRLLVEAVEANKAIPIWRRAWVYWALGGVALLLLGFFFGPNLWNMISSVIQPDFVKSTIAYMEENPPDFQDNFSSTKREWSHVLFDNSRTDTNLSDYIKNGATFENGAFVASRIGGEAWGEIGLGDLKGNTPLVGTDFALQLDVNAINFGEQSAFVIYYRAIEPLQNNFFGINGSGDWFVMFRNLEHDEEEIVSGETNLFKVGETNQVQILAQGEDVAIYINGKHLTHFKHSEVMGEYAQFSFASEDERFHASVDNVKFWNLGDVVQVEETPTTTPTLTLDPAIQQALNTIQNTPPDYQNNFDTWDFVELPEDATYASIDTGKLVLTSEGEHVGLGLDIFDSDQLAIEFEFNILDAGPEGHCPFYTDGYGYSDRETHRSTVSVFDNSGGIEFALMIPADTQKDFAYSSFDPSISNKYTLIILGDKIAGFINGELVYEVSDPNGKAMLTISNFAATHGITCEYDNFKAWDLSVLSPEMQTALNFIEAQPPAYQTDFETWEFENPAENANADHGKLVLSGDGFFVQMPDPGFQSDSFAVQFDFRISQNSLEQFACGFHTDNQGNDGTDKALWAGFHPNTPLVLQHKVPPNYKNLYYGDRIFDFSEFNTFTLIVLGDQIAGFMNGETAYTATNPDGRVVFEYQQFEGGGNGDCEFDNYKIWDLRVLSPEIQAGLEFIETQTPDYQTGFDSWDFGDPVENASVEDGKLILTGENQIGPHVEINNFSSDYFAVEFEFRNLQSETNSSCNFNIGNEQESWSESWIALGAQFNEQRALLWRFIYPDGEDFVWESYEGSSVNKVTLLILGDRITAFVNGELIYTVLNPDGSIAFSHHTLGMYAANERYICEFDNYKFWDLRDGDVTVKEEAPETTPTTTSDPRILNPENQHLYLVPATNGKLWHQARDYCESQGGYLVTIQDDAENQFVYELHPDTWLGATDKDSEGTWTWASGEPWLYTNWDPGEPNDKDGNENYLSFKPEAPSKWNDSSSDRREFVCEWYPDLAAFDVESISAYLEKTSPSFNDDFNGDLTLDEWGRDSDRNAVYNLWQNGTLLVTKRNADLMLPTNGLFKATDFAMAFDFFPDKLAGSGRFGLAFRSSEDTNAYYNFSISYSPLSTVDSWLFSESDGTTVRTTKISPINLKDDYNHVLIIAQQEYLAIFVNEQLVHKITGLASWGDEILFINSGPTNGSSIRLDNVQFWNLDDVEFSISEETMVPK